MTHSYTTRERLEDALARIEAPDGQGKETFTRVYRDEARVVASATDDMRRLGMQLPSLAGCIVSIKDLFDVRGEATMAGAKVLADAAPAAQDAEVVRRLRQAGAVIVGKTNMTEFAFSGLGINPHFGTPLNQWDRGNSRIPGGSSSGAAISITDGMADIAIGTDTGGSCRIPAALNGIVGMKPSAASVPSDGALPLSSSYDVIGPIAGSVERCAQAYAVLSGQAQALKPISPRKLTLGVIQNYVLQDMDADVAAAHAGALTRLSRAGVELRDVSLPVLDELPALFDGGGLVAAESYAWHRELMHAQGDAYDPRVSVRIQRGAAITAADYIQLLQLRKRLVAAWREQIGQFDAVVMPTVPLVAPKMQTLETDDEYGRINLLMLRNPTTINALDGCAVSLPCHLAGQAPVGLSLACANGKDWDLLSMAQSLAPVLQP